MRRFWLTLLFLMIMVGICGCSRDEVIESPTEAQPTITSEDEKVSAIGLEAFLTKYQRTAFSLYETERFWVEFVEASQVRMNLSEYEALGHFVSTYSAYNEADTVLFNSPAYVETYTSPFLIAATLSIDLETGKISMDDAETIADEMFERYGNASYISTTENGESIEISEHDLREIFTKNNPVGFYCEWEVKSEIYSFSVSASTDADTLRLNFGCTHNYTVEETETFLGISESQKTAEQIEAERNELTALTESTKAEMLDVLAEFEKTFLAAKRGTNIDLTTEISIEEQLNNFMQIYKTNLEHESSLLYIRAYELDTLVDVGENFHMLDAGRYSRYAWCSDDVTEIITHLDNALDDRVINEDDSYEIDRIESCIETIYSLIG